MARLIQAEEKAVELEATILHAVSHAKGFADKSAVGHESVRHVLRLHPVIVVEESDCFYLASVNEYVVVRAQGDECTFFSQQVKQRTGIVRCNLYFLSCSGNYKGFVCA